MRRRDTSFTLALCASIAVHGWLLSEMSWRYVMDNVQIWLAGYGQQAFVALSAPDEKLGSSQGTGTAIDRSEGAEPLEARKDEQTQIFGSLDPEGQGELRAAPSPSVLPQGGSISKPEAVMEQPPVPPSFGVQSASMMSDLSEIGRLARKSGSQSQTPSQSEQSTPAKPSQPPSQAASAGAPFASANPAPQTDTESDPMTETGGVRFRNGRVAEQFGRKHKLTYPRFSLAAETAMLQLRPPVYVVLKLNLDMNGNVTRVEVVRSSGSNDIDHPCRIAAYSWWLEPSRDRDGNPVEDVILFTIRFT